MVDCQGHIFLLKIQTDAHVHPPNLKHNLRLNIATDAALAARVMIEGRRGGGKRRDGSREEVGQ